MRRVSRPREGQGMHQVPEVRIQVRLQRMVNRDPDPGSGIRDAGSGIRDPGFGIRDSGFESGARRSSRRLGPRHSVLHHPRRFGVVRDRHRVSQTSMTRHDSHMSTTSHCAHRSILRSRGTPARLRAGERVAAAHEESRLDQCGEDGAAQRRIEAPQARRLRLGQLKSWHLQELACARRSARANVSAAQCPRIGEPCE